MFLVFQHIIVVYELIKDFIYNSFIDILRTFLEENFLELISLIRVFYLSTLFLILISSKRRVLTLTKS